MDINFFKETRILDGGMGQELLARGMEPNGTGVQMHCSMKNIINFIRHTYRFYKSRRWSNCNNYFYDKTDRLKDNKVEDKFEYLMKEVK